MLAAVQRRCREVEAALEEERLRCERLENLARSRARMADLGSMVSNLAHDFNNMLTPILGAAQLALDELADGPSETQQHLREDLEMVLVSAERAGVLVRQMIQFGRDSLPHTTTIDCVTVLREATTLVRAATPRSIEVRQRILSRSLVEGDPAQLRQLLVALASHLLRGSQAPANALTLSLMEESEGNEDWVVFGLMAATGYQDVSNQSTCGEVEALWEHAVAAHGGRVQVGAQSAQVRFPRRVRLAASGGTNELHIAHQRARVLVVDTDPDVAQQTERVARGLGVRTLVSPSFELALQRVRERLNDVDVLIVGGDFEPRVRLLAELRRIRADLAFVVMAQPDEPVEELDGLHVVVKPFEVADLRVALSAAVAQARGTS